MSSVSIPDRMFETARHYMRSLTFNHHQISSFNWFTERSVSPILDGFDPITCSDVLTIEPEKKDVHSQSSSSSSSSPPVLTIKVCTKDAHVLPSTQEPADCLSRQVDYVCTLVGTIEVEIRLRDEVVWKAEYKDFTLGWVPAMVLSRQCKVGLELYNLEQEWIQKHGLNNPSHLSIRSPACSLEPSVRSEWRKARQDVLARHRLDQSEIGGYFIARGAEKVVLIQERLTNSMVYVFPPDDKESVGVVQYDKPIIAECRSHSVKQFKQEMFSLTYSAIPNRPIHVIRAVLPKFKIDFPLFVLLRALLPLPPSTESQDDKSEKESTSTDTDLPTFQSAEEVARLLMMFCTRPNQEECFHDLTRALRDSERESYRISSTRQCLYYMGQRCKLPDVSGNEELSRSASIQQTILKELFPHLSQSPLLGKYSPVPMKLHFMMFMLYRLLSVVLKWEPFDDRDHYSNKRMDTPGALLRILYRQIMIRQVRELQKNVVTGCKVFTQKKTSNSRSHTVQTFEQMMESLKHQLRKESFERWWTPRDNRGRYTMGIQKEFSVALSTGNWSKNTYASAVASSVVMRAVSQYYKRSNYISQIGEQRRVNLPVSKNSTNTRPRQVHPSQWMVVCPSTTPEDESVGFMKNLALACCISHTMNTESIYESLLKEIEPFQSNVLVDERTKLPITLTWVMLNGNVLGAVPYSDREQLYQNIRTRVKIAIPDNNMMGVSFQKNGRLLQIQTDEGRCCRPLVVLEHIDKWLTGNTFALLPLDQMVRNGWIEWMDVAETTQHAIAVNWTYLNDLHPSERVHFKYMELHPSLVAGFAASIVPYAHMNPGPRVAYAASMAGSAIGAYGTNIHQERDDSLFDNLDYPQKSLTPTAWATEAFCHELPSVQNAVVAILSHGGNNQEDAVIVSQRAIDLGMFRSTRYRSFRDTSSCASTFTKEYMGRELHQFEASENKSLRPVSVDADGFTRPGFKLQEGDVLMHKNIIKEKIELIDQQKTPVAESTSASSTTKRKSRSTSTTTKKVKASPPPSQVSSAPVPICTGVVPEQQTSDLSIPQPLPIDHINLKLPEGKRMGKLLNSMNNPDTSANNANSIKFHDPAVVDRVMVTTNEMGDTICKVRTRASRVPKIGDKLASQGPQKGVIGEFRRPEDMPFCQDGIIPDLVLITHCLVGDTPVWTNQGVMKISDVVERASEVCVGSFNSSTHQYGFGGITKEFKKSSTSVVQLRTWSNDVIKCTPDHPFMVYEEGQYIWKRADTIKLDTDRVVMQPRPNCVLSDEGDLPVITFDDSDPQSLIKKLEQRGLTGKLSLRHTKLLAKLMGFVQTDGNLSRRGGYSYRACMYIGTREDYDEIKVDVEQLGFEALALIRQPESQHYGTVWCTQLQPALSFLLYKLGTTVGRKTIMAKTIPDWLLKAPPSVKAMFLSGYQGGDGSKLFVDVTRTNPCTLIHETKCTTRKTVLEQNTKYMEQVRSLFQELGIVTTLSVHPAKEDTSMVFHLHISNVRSNILRYCDVIDYAYCAGKRYASALPIQFLRMHMHGYDLDYRNFCRVFSTLSGMEIDDQIRKEYKRLGKYDSRLGTVFTYVESRESVPTELVYDFTTISDHHNFVASSFVVHNCIPSRMTLAQLASMLAGTIACMTGRVEDSTTFREDYNIAESLAKGMLENGFTPHGSQTMYDGYMGVPLEGEVFIGVTTYQRMRQMTEDKYHVRARGQVQLLSRQPTEGKATSGGLRFGEMERDAAINAGVSNFLAEKYGRDSDGDLYHICPECQSLCKNQCPEHPETALDIVHIPQAFALMVAELRAMSINAKLVVK